MGECIPRMPAYTSQAKAKTDLKEADKRVRKLQHELSAMEELNVDDASQARGGRL